MKPNILLLIPDQHRGDWLEYPEELMKQMGQQDLKLETPNIRRLMEKGTTFTTAYSPCPTCAPARACLASGMRYRNCRVQDNNINFDPTLPTFYKVLKDGGYRVGSVGKLDLNKANHCWSNTEEWRVSLERIGFTDVIDSEGKGDGVTAYVYDGTPGPYLTALDSVELADIHVQDIVGRAHKDHPTKLPDEYYGDNWVAERGLEILKEFPKDNPWFLQVNFPGPHNPWDVTESMKEAYKDRIYPEPVGDAKRPKNMNGIMQNYAAMINNIDRNVGLFLDMLKERGDLDNTIVVYTSDHGEMMGDFGRFYKCRPEQGAVRIPMIIDASCCGGCQGVITDAPMELEDLAATFLDYAKLPIPEKWQSLSVRPILEGATERVRQYATSEYIYTQNRETHMPYVGSWHTITDGTYKLVEFDNNPTALYDLNTDPRELNNLMEAMPEKVEEFKNAFIEEIPKFRHFLAEADKKMMIDAVVSRTILLTE